MDIIASRRLVLDGKAHEAGQKVTTDDDTANDLIRLCKATPKPDPKAAKASEPAHDKVTVTAITGETKELKGTAKKPA